MPGQRMTGASDLKALTTEGLEENGHVPLNQGWRVELEFRDKRSLRKKRLYEGCNEGCGKYRVGFQFQAGVKAVRRMPLPLHKNSSILTAAFLGNAVARCLVERAGLGSLSLGVFTTRCLAEQAGVHHFAAAIVEAHVEAQRAKQNLKGKEYGGERFHCWQM